LSQKQSWSTIKSADTIRYFSLPVSVKSWFQNISFDLSQFFINKLCYLFFSCFTGFIKSVKVLFWTFLIES
jgi:hypothetical protein